jgi:uncharacterized protein YbjQ (UPF0145 family)
MLVSTINDIPGHTVVRCFGIGRDVAVGSRSERDNFAAAIQSPLRGDANEFMEGITEVLAYGTAAVVDA